jgi:DNA adenine methylase
LIVETVKAQYDGGTFGELFFGGGAITFKLLKLRVLESIIINEKDPSLARLWNAVIKTPCRLRSGIRAVKPSVDLFLRSKDRVLRGVGSGLEALIVNRMSYGGRGVKANPQGGLKQESKYKIDCRWKPDALCRNVTTCHKLLYSVEIRGGKCHAEDYAAWFSHVDLMYLDPPYWEKGEGLYLHSFDGYEHERLRRALSSRINWILSYNNVDEVKLMYNGYHRQTGTTNGNGGFKEDSEILITPWEMHQ